MRATVAAAGVPHQLHIRCQRRPLLLLCTVKSAPVTDAQAENVEALAAVSELDKFEARHLR